MSVFRCIALAVALITSSASWGWGQTGHRITGEIAQSRISGKTTAELEMILGKQGLAEMTTWPDEQRSNPQPFWQNDANPWHYVTLPTGQQPSELVSPAEGDALPALYVLRQLCVTVKNHAMKERLPCGLSSTLSGTFTNRFTSATEPTAAAMTWKLCGLVSNQICTAFGMAK